MDLGNLGKPKSGTLVPDIYCWKDFDAFTKEPVSMTAAFTYMSKKFGPTQFGMTYPVEKEWSKSQRVAYQRKLLRQVMDTLDILVHHGDDVLDADRNINPKKFNDKEAERFYLDKDWEKRVNAFHSVVRVKLINTAKARELKLI
jgi:hypothetical protein